MRNYSDIIFALSTNKAKSALAVFRISGKKSISSFLQLINIKKIEIKKPSICYILDNNKNKIDKVVVTAFKSPKSYTGEDMIEISSHGSIAVINKITAILISNNFRPALPGEFTKRALINNKIGVLEAETINEIINSETENQRKLAIGNFGGKREGFIEEISKKIMKLLANVEAIIDFADEDLPKNLYKEIMEQKENIVKELDKTIYNSLLSKNINTGYKITVIGKPNTGKSSFINFINNKEISIVTSIPGTTTDVVSSVLEISGNKYIFYDTAGIRKHRNIIEKIGIEKTLKNVEISDLNLIFLENDEKNNYSNIKNKIFVKSKHDIYKSKVPGAHNISSKSGYGIKSLLNKIVRKTYSDTINEPTFSRERHLESLKKAHICLKRVNLNKIDISAENIRSSLIHIQGINQKIDIEKILDIIFSEFCIGK
mgnify:CR=1 FL=1